jgi:hypothetical protein
MLKIHRLVDNFQMFNIAENDKIYHNFKCSRFVYLFRFSRISTLIYITTVLLCISQLVCARSLTMIRFIHCYMLYSDFLSNIQQLVVLSSVIFVIIFLI